MKKLDRNKGFTLIELLVSIAILSLIIVAVGGIMYSNNLIYRKEKADITVQGSAQDVYNKINEDIMQAKHIYFEGYVTDTKLTFATNKIQDNTVTVEAKKFLLPTDQYVLDNSSNNPAALISLEKERSVSSRDKLMETLTDDQKAKYEKLLNTTEDKLQDELKALSDDELETYKKLRFYTPEESDEIAKGLTGDAKDLYYAYHNRFRYFSANEKSEEVTFLNSIPTKSNVAFSDLSEGEGAGKKYKYIYITKMIIVYSQRADEKFMSDTSAYEAEKNKAEYLDSGKLPTDDVTVTYTFGGTGTEKQVRCDYKYKYMDKLDTSNYSDNEVLTKQLNYATSNGTVIPGCEAQVDSENNSMRIFLYFADNSMTYVDRGMVKIRNTNVLNDPK